MNQPKTFVIGEEKIIIIGQGTFQILFSGVRVSYRDGEIDKVERTLSKIEVKMYDRIYKLKKGKLVKIPIPRGISTDDNH